MKKMIIKRFNDMKNAHERILYQEYIIFCNYATDRQFENFMKDKLKYKEFFNLVDFFVANKCFLLLSRLLRYHGNNHIKSNIKVIKKMKLRKDIQKRLKRFVM